MNVKLISVTQPLVKTKDGTRFLSPEELIVYTARVSNPNNQLNVETGAKLLKYCLQHKHWSIFEMVDLTVEIQTSRAIAPQILRHRTANFQEFCISGNSDIWFDLPCGNLHKIKIKDLYRKFHAGATPIKRRGVSWDMSNILSDKFYSPSELARVTGKSKLYSNNIRNLCQKNKIPYTKSADGRIAILGKDIIQYYTASHNQYHTIDLKDKIKKMSVRMYNETSKRLEHGRIKDVFYCGKKPVYHVKLRCGRNIVCTKEHRFLSKNGFVDLESLVNLVVDSNNQPISFDQNQLIATNGIPVYQSFEWMKQTKQEAINNKTGVQGIADQAGCSYMTIRKWLKKFKLQFSRKEVSAMFDVWNKGLSNSYKLRPRTALERQAMSAQTPKGKYHHSWKGGGRPERIWIQTFINQYRNEIYQIHGASCKHCLKDKVKLYLHHVEEVSRNPYKAYDLNNIIPLCHPCHMAEHERLRNIPFETLYDLENFDWESVRPPLVQEKMDAGVAPFKFSNSRTKTINKKNNLRRTIGFSEIVDITYAGVEDTYDLEIDHSSHNYVANGIICHNSQRYSSAQTFEPIEWRLQGKTNRQVGDEVIELPPDLNSKIEKHLADSKELYNELIDKNYAKECARMILPLTTQTTLYMKNNVRNWIHYIELRTKPDTQKEHRQIAEGIKKIFIENFPVISEALEWTKLSTTTTLKK